MTGERWRQIKHLAPSRRFFHVSTLAYMIPNPDKSKLHEPYIPMIRQLGTFRYAEKGGEYTYVFDGTQLKDLGATSYVDTHPRTKHHARKAARMAA